MTADGLIHDLLHGLHMLMPLLEEHGVRGTLAILAPFVVAALVFGAWFWLAEWMLRRERSLPITYCGASVAALAALALTRVLASFDRVDLDPTLLKAWYVGASLAYGLAVGSLSRRERHTRAIAFFGLATAWAAGVFLLWGDLYSFNIPYFFAGFTVAGVSLGLLLAKLALTMNRNQ